MAKVATTGFTVSDVPFGESVKAGELLGWSEGRLVKASASSLGVIPAIGVAAAAYKEGDLGAMHLACVVAGFSELTPGDQQYLSTTETGAIQASVPSGSGNLKQAVGYAVAADRIALVFQDAGATL